MVDLLVPTDSLIRSKPKVRLNVSTFSFYSRVVDSWNILPNRVVSAGSVNSSYLLAGDSLL